MMQFLVLPGLGRVAISCCSMVTSTKLGLFEVTWYGGSGGVVILAQKVIKSRDCKFEQFQIG